MATKNANAPKSSQAPTKNTSAKQRREPTVIEVVRPFSLRFNPWSATLDQAMLADEDCGLSLGDPIRPLSQFNAAQVIESERAAVEGGDGFAVLACIRKCANHDLVMPEWLALAFISRYDRVLNCRASSWDDESVFGKPYPKGAHLSKLRHARENRHRVHLAVVAAIKENPKRAINRNLFEEVGKALEMKSTTVQTYYYEIVKRMGYGAKGAPRSRSESRSKSIVNGGARLASLKWGGK